MVQYTIHREVIPETRVRRRRLGRHVHHDSRSLSYRVTSVATPITTTRKRLIPILDQGNLGSCTGNAETGALGCEGVLETISAILATKNLQLNEDFAVKLYSAATTIDPYPGAYPPDDTGSDGLSVSKAAAGTTNPAGQALISGYVNATTVDEITAGLQANAGIIGINWYSSFDTPDANGVVSLPATATVRGGHEVNVVNVDVDKQQFECANSWGTGWGLSGYFYIPFTVMERLMSEAGDANFPVPLTAPAPTPTPPPPSGLTRTFTQDAVNTLDTWAAQRHVGANKAAANAWKSGVATG